MSDYKVEPIPKGTPMGDPFESDPPVQPDTAYKISQGNTPIASLWPGPSTYAAENECQIRVDDIAASKAMHADLEAQGLLYTQLDTDPKALTKDALIAKSDIPHVLEEILGLPQATVAEVMQKPGMGNWQGAVGGGAPGNDVLHR